LSDVGYIYYSGNLNWAAQNVRLGWAAGWT